MRSDTRRIILASKSPRRFDLLSGLGFFVISLPSEIDEDKIGNESPSNYAIRLARTKAENAKRKIENDDLLNKLLIVGADTIVLCDNNILGKPKDKSDARKMLLTLSGRYHTVYTAYALISQIKNQRIENIVKTEVKFKRLREAEIEGYINTDEPYDKAGGYAAQGIGAFLIERIEGSYTNVVGLPLCEIVNDLETNGWLSLF